ncbi:MAG TPA: Mpo1-like protein [Rhizomicrobium sp.]|nr:Mpo1-like protein [Rhizomicrobium sp.]
MQRYASFAEFYPFYLREHSQRITRRLHFVGSSLGLLCLLELLFTGDIGWLALGLACGYGFAWFAHFVFEKNRPATFRQPLYSFMGDCKQILTGRIAF